MYRWTRSGYVRGAVTGLGALNLGAGLVELAAAWAVRRRADDRQSLSDLGGAPQEPQ